jgi:hypothetical protein
MEMENDNLIKRFLFGELSEEERFHLEERFVSDALLFGEIRAVEDELIEKYVRGWMDREERSKFQRFFLTSNKRRERIEFSRQLITTIDQRKKTASVPSKDDDESIADNGSIWERIAAHLPTRRLALAVGLTLVLAMAGIGVWYKNQIGHEPEMVSNASNGPVESPPEEPVVQTAIPDNDDQHNGPGGANDATESKPGPKSAKTLEEPKSTSTPTDDTPTAGMASNPVLALFAGTLRSSGKNSVLRLPKEAKAATLRLNLEHVEHASFQAELTDADGNVLFQKAKLKSRKSRIDLVIPARRLKPGDYLIKLSGTNDGPGNEPVADFQFRVLP